MNWPNCRSIFKPQFWGGNNSAPIQPHIWSPAMLTYFTFLLAILGALTVIAKTYDMIESHFVARRLAHDQRTERLRELILSR